MDFYKDQLITGSNDKTIRLYKFENNIFTQLRIWVAGDFILTVKIRRHGEG